MALEFNPKTDWTDAPDPQNPPPGARKIGASDLNRYEAFMAAVADGVNALNENRDKDFADRLLASDSLTRKALLSIQGSASNTKILTPLEPMPAAGSLPEGTLVVRRVAQQ